MEFDWFTFFASLIGSLAVAYIGVRYFTGSRIRAERAEHGKQRIRLAANALIRDANSYQQRWQTALHRDEATLSSDGAHALRFLRMAVDLPWWRRKLITRRCRRVFGKRWTYEASLRGEGMTVSDDDTAVMFLRALMESHEGTGTHIVGTGTPIVTFRDGLMQRAYETEPPSPLVAQLIRELTRLSRAR